VTQTKELKDYFRRNNKQKDFFARELQNVVDAHEVLSFAEDSAVFGPFATPDGLPPISVLITAWWSTRNSWARLTQALPPGELREEMIAGLAKRDAAMHELQEKAIDQVQQLAERELTEQEGVAAQ
jgi:hypothetical protein